MEHDYRSNSSPAQNGAFYINDVFGSAKPVFLAISSGEDGTAVYLNGALSRASREFRLSPGDCAGRLVIGTSPFHSDPWTGELRGLALYRNQLTSAQVLQHYQAWTRQGRPEMAGGPGCVALFLFDEHGGRRVRDQIPPGPGLLIPERYRILDQTLLRPFWKEFEFSWNYAKDVLRNIAGFVPLGFLFYAWFIRYATARGAAWITVILGMTVSITIEVLQAFLPTRQSGVTDIITNTLGTWLGASLCAYLNRWPFWPNEFPSKGRR